MEDKIRLEILGLSSSQSEVGHYALVLGEVSGNRRLPIIIDGFQARAIAFEIENIKPNRPMTHDLIVSICKSIDMELLEVVITRLKDGIFYAQLLFEHNGEIHEIDSRTSDAVAIAVRFKVPIFTYESVLTVAGIEVKGSDADEDDEYFGEEDDDDEELTDFDEDVEELSISDRIKRLKDQINDAIGREDYETAARLRDEISKLEEQN